MTITEELPSVEKKKIFRSFVFLCPGRDCGRHIKIAPSTHQSICVFVASKSYLSHNLKTTEANVMKLHRKIKHTEKVCHAQELGSNFQGQGCSRVRGQIMS